MVFGDAEVSSIALSADSLAFQAAELQYSMTGAAQLVGVPVRSGTDSMIALARGVSQR